MSNQIKLEVAARDDKGKGAAGRLRRDGRVPAIVYGYKVEPTPVSVDALELFRALHSEAGRNALLQVALDGETHLAVARDLVTHPVKGKYVHVDLLAVDKDQQISVDIPVHLLDDEDTGNDDGVLNQILYTVPILVRPMDVPNSFEISVAGMLIGDVKRVEELAEQLPDGAEFDIEPERTVVTVNAPVSEAELEALEEGAGIEADEPEGEEGDEESAEGESDDEGESDGEAKSSDD
ncbi:MAG: 50S ribosomal protein L25 [Nitriliruptoraceae bacterium]